VDGAAVIEETVPGSYDDVPEAGVHVYLAVPLLAPVRSATPDRPSHRAATAAAPARRGARHARREPSVVRETLLLGVTAAVVVLAGVVLILALADWLG
jgi:hypothetical protein